MNNNFQNEAPGAILSSIVSALGTPEADAIATIVADKCQGSRKPGDEMGRDAMIWQAARLGAIEAMSGIKSDAACEADHFEREGNSK